MKKIIIGAMVFSFLNYNTAEALPTGAPVCDVLDNFSNITGMQDRPRNQNPGPFNVSSNVSNYTPGQSVDITISGPTFAGVMFSVVDENGDRVGSFSLDSSVTNCDNGALSITHNDTFGSVMTKTLTWNAPNSDIGTVYVLGYVLRGTRGNASSQEFHRFVRSDNSAISIDGPAGNDIIFVTGFEAP